MKKILVTIDDKACTELNIELERLIKEYLDHKSLYTSCPPTIGMEIAMEGLELELSKREGGKKAFEKKAKEEQKAFIKDYLMHDAFAKMFNLAHLVQDAEIVEE